MTSSLSATAHQVVKAVGGRGFHHFGMSLFTAADARLAVECRVVGSSPTAVPVKEGSHPLLLLFFSHHLLDNIPLCVTSR